MNWKYKSLILGSAATIGLCPSVAMMASCSKTFDQIINEISNDVTSEFMWICQHYRNTFHNREFCHELYKRVKKMGYEVVREWDETNNLPLPYDYKGTTHYRPDEDDDTTRVGHTTFGYDMYFDIPANVGDESYPGIILQAHTDMVSVDDSESTGIKYDWSQGVIPVVENGWMHSKDNRTSLGADDGAGVATILALAKHAGEFKHGKIRCIFTVDEEDGPSGAKYVPSEWLEGFNYYLSLDGEKSHINWNYCAGSQQAQLTLHSADPSTVRDSEFEIAISGLKGGHSGLLIHECHMNPVILMGEVIQYLLDQSAFTADTLRLVESYENKANGSPSGGTIPSSITFRIQGETTLSAKQIGDLVKARVDAAHKETYQSCPDDNPAIAVVAVDAEERALATTGISVATTAALAEVLSKYGYGTGEYQIYGFLKDAEQKFPEVGCSVASVRTGKNNATTKDDPSQLYIEFFGRSTDLTKLNNFMTNDTGVFPVVKNKLATTASPAPTLNQTFYSKPWIKSENSLQQIIHNASTYYGNELSDEPVFGWLEICEMYAKKSSINYGIIGPQIEDVHTTKERLQVSSIPLMVKLVLYIVGNLTTINDTNK